MSRLFHLHCKTSLLQHLSPARIAQTAFNGRHFHGLNPLILYGLNRDNPLGQFDRFCHIAISGQSSLWVKQTLRKLRLSQGENCEI
jgi:hypothetical protein